MLGSQNSTVSTKSRLHRCGSASIAGIGGRVRPKWSPQIAGFGGLDHDHKTTHVRVAARIGRLYLPQLRGAGASTSGGEAMTPLLVGVLCGMVIGPTVILFGIGLWVLVKLDHS